MTKTLTTYGDVADLFDLDLSLVDVEAGMLIPEFGTDQSQAQGDVTFIPAAWAGELFDAADWAPIGDDGVKLVEGEVTRQDHVACRLAGRPVF